MQPADNIEMVARSDPGRMRAQNEDAVFADASLGLAVLADGMGGYKGGKVASEMAVRLFAGQFVEVLGNCAGQLTDACGPLFVQAQIRTLITRINQAIFAAARQEPEYANMGTTLVLAWLYDKRLCVAHVGDSRLYRLRGDVFQQMTRDHSPLQDQIDRGIISVEDARYAENRNLVNRALGAELTVNVECGDMDVQAGDVYLLCSDGLNDMLTDQEIRQIILSHPDSLVAVADELIEIANVFGGRDNVSVILIKVRASDIGLRRWWKKLLAAQS